MSRQMIQRMDICLGWVVALTGLKRDETEIDRLGWKLETRSSASSWMDDRTIIHPFAQGVSEEHHTAC